MIEIAKKTILDTHIRRNYINGFAKSGINRKWLEKELYSRHLFKQSGRVELCGRRVNEFIDIDTGEKSIYTIYRCNLRCCPDCAQRKAHNLFMAYFKFFKIYMLSDEYKILFSKGYRFSHIILTVKKAPTMKESLQDLVRGFSRWWRDAFGKIKKTFAIGDIEVTINKHVHMHILLFAPYWRLRKNMRYKCLDCGVEKNTKYNDPANFRCRICKSKNVKIIGVEKTEIPTLQDYWIEASRVVHYHCLCGHSWTGNKTGRVKCPECKNINTMTKKVIRVSDVVGMKSVKVSKHLYNFKSALREVLKYCFKPASTSNVEFLVDVMNLFYRKKLLRIKGDLYDNEILNRLKEIQKMDMASLFENYEYFGSFGVQFFVSADPAGFIMKIFDVILNENEFQEMFNKAILEYLRQKGFRPPPARCLTINERGDTLTECLSRLMAVVGNPALYRQGLLN